MRLRQALGTLDGMPASPVVLALEGPASHILLLQLQRGIKAKANDADFVESTARSTLAPLLHRDSADR